jgi:DNA-directed RNA polymerase subunit F
MILGSKAQTFAEVKEIIKDLEEKKELKSYLKKFNKLTKEKSEKLKEEIRELKNLKIKEEDIVKVVDFLPKDKEELNKVFAEISLSEEETNAILEIIKKY